MFFQTKSINETSRNTLFGNFQVKTVHILSQSIPPVIYDVPVQLFFTLPPLLFFNCMN